MTPKDAGSPAASHPVVSVCIANYNGIEVIDDCIRSIVEQRGSIPVEILIHDDASTDGSADYIKAHYPNATLIESSDNVGFCVANNRLAAIARGDYLLLLNNDAALFPDALQTLLCEAERLNTSAILSLPQYDAQTGDLIDIGCLLDPFLNPVPNQNPQRNDVGMVIGACLWISKMLWNELEGFPEWFESIGEDLYLCCRARLAGNPVRALGQSGYRHRVGSSFGGGRISDGKLITTYTRRALSERNKTFVMVMHYPALLILLTLPIHIILLLIECFFLSAFHMKTLPIKRIYIPLWPALFRRRWLLATTRKNIMSNAKVHTKQFFLPFVWAPRKLQMLFKHGIPKLV